MSGTITFEARGAGPPLVFLHGVGGDAACWRPQLEAFARSHRAIAWNMPGYGGSAPLAEMTCAALADALVQFLDELAIERAYLVGHSMGGMVAQEFVATRPARVRALSLVATSAAFGRADGAWQRAFVQQRLGPLDRGATMTELAPAMAGELVGEGADPEAIEKARRSLAAVPEATYRAAIQCLLGFDRRAALARLDVPCLLIAGERDNVAPPEMMARMAARIAGARLVVLPRAGHLANLEQPVAFNEALAGFLGEVEAGA